MNELMTKVGIELLGQLKTQKKKSNLKQLQILISNVQPQMYLEQTVKAVKLRFLKLSPNCLFNCLRPTHHQLSLA